jgi:hypothetical protein
LYRKLGGLRTGLDGTEILTPPGFDPRTVQSIAELYSDYTIPATKKHNNNNNNNNKTTTYNTFIQKCHRSKLLGSAIRKQNDS